MSKSIFQRAAEAVVNNTTGQIHYGAEIAIRHVEILDKWIEVHEFAHSINPEYDCSLTGQTIVEGLKAEATQIEGLARIGYSEVMKVHQASKTLDAVVRGEQQHNPFEGMTFIPVETDGTESPEDLLTRARQAMQDTRDLQHMADGSTIADPHDPDEEPGAVSGNNGEDDK